MKHNVFSHDPNQRPPVAPPAPAAAKLSQNETDFVRSPDEVARRAYFSYLSQGSLHGHHVQHWLEAEAQLLAERNLTRVHGFHNHPHNKVTDKHQSHPAHNQPLSGADSGAMAGPKHQYQYSPPAPEEANDLSAE
jgi:Protein of unknown function (DUF2934)